jgi:tRNA-2-methylthio-N6-dimethylallyladenosine synthase
MFIFSPRPGTAAAEMEEDFVDPDLVQTRFERLASLQNRISGERNQELVGTSQEVLTEGPSKKDPDMATTRTRGGKLVHVPGHFDPGLFAHARIEAAFQHHLVGSLI